MIIEGVQQIKEVVPRLDLYINKYMPTQMYQLIVEALEGSLKHAPKQQRLDMLQTVNERAQVIYMDAKSVKQGRKGLEGSVWSCEQLFNIALDAEIEQMTEQVNAENRLLQEQREEERKRLES